MQQSITIFMTASLLVGLSMTSCLEPRGYDRAERAECAECHGGQIDDPNGPAEWIAAPPFNLAGKTDPASRGNGAHATHLVGTGKSRPLSCSDCHLVPLQVDDAGHMDDPYPAEVEFAWGPAWAFEATPEFDEETQSCKQTFCHGGYFVGGRPSGGKVTEPKWTDISGAPARCDGCHGQPPPDPHPVAETCSDCHKNMDENGDFLRPDLHVDGKVTFFLPSD